MKTKSWTLTVLAFLITSVGFAAKRPTMNVTPIEENKALLAYKATEAATLEITLSDCNGTVLYFKRTSSQKAEFKEVFDFSNFNNGSYCMAVNYGNKSISRNLTINGQEIKVGAAAWCYEPYFHLEGKKLNISFYNSLQKQVYVNIYKNGNHVDGFKLGKDLAIQKRLDLSHLPLGNYEVVVTDPIKGHRFFVKL